MTSPPLDCGALLREQLDWHWDTQLRPRLDDLADEEYQWEPVPEAWNVRARGTSGAPIQAGSGTFTIDFAYPEPRPAPVTTIAWRLGHLIVGCLAARNASHFEGPVADYDTWVYAGDAAGALAQLDEQMARWRTGVAALGPAGLSAPCGSTEGPYAALPMATLVLHINREIIHHGAEIALLRDLYAHR
ncbi:MAG TPA: DinB family protein [Dermatophilaceae bacterium]|nr:DinB family protein [Dermatophilaceae bacterium]